MRAWWGLLACAFLAGAIVAGCSSDAFGPVGRTLPPEVGQDSLGIADTLLAVDAQTALPELSQAYDDRQMLLFGKRIGSGASGLADVQATPLIRFDFGAIYGDPFQASAANWERVRLYWYTHKHDIQLHVFPDSVENSCNPLLNQAPTSEPKLVRIYELADTLRAEDQMVSPLGSLLGPQLLEESSPVGLTNYVDLMPSGGSSVDTTTAFYPRFREWLTAGSHTGLALFDATTAYDDIVSDSIVRITSQSFPRSRLLDVAECETGSPCAAPSYFLRIEIEYSDESKSYILPAYDFTHLMRGDDAVANFHMGSHEPSRAWVQFDFGGATIPTNATITRAFVELSLQEEYAVGTCPVNIEAYEISALDAPAASLAGFRRIRGSGADFAPQSISLLRVNVTEYVQRVVNGLVESDIGVMVRLTSEVETYSHVPFNPVTSAAELRPRIVLEYTPPPDFQQ